MTVLAIRLANTTNGVSKLHGRCRARCGRASGPSCPRPRSRSPRSPTASTRAAGWPPEMAQLYDRYLGIQWEERPTDHSIWKRVDNIPDAELWRTHERRRERLVAFARSRLQEQLERRGAPPAEIARADEVLDPGGPDHRLRPPLRHLQARHADLPQPRAAGRHHQQQGPAGADRLRRQGPPARPRRQGADRRDPAHRPPAGVPPPHRLPRGLRHQRGPLPGAGRRRLAEQPAPAAGGLGHQRHEGLLQRRPQPAASSTAGGSRATPATTAGPSAPARSTPT